MQVAKLNNGRIVKLIKHQHKVMFSKFEHSLVNDNLNAIPQRYKPYWIISTSVVWVMDIGEST